MDIELDILVSPKEEITPVDLRSQKTKVRVKVKLLRTYGNICSIL